MIEKFGREKACLIGKAKSGEKVFLDTIKPHVIFICGARGSGKSYTMGVIVEGLAEVNDAIAGIVIDPIGVFWSMKRANYAEKEVEELKKWGLEPKGFKNVRVLVPIGVKGLPRESFDGFFSIKPCELRTSDWCFAFDIDRFSPAGLLLDLAIKKAGEEYSIEDLVRVISTDPELQSKEKGFSKQTRRGLISRLESAKYWGIFSERATPIEFIAQPGQITIIDTSFLEEPVAALVTGILARKLLSRRKVESRKEALGEPSTFPPVWLFIDEAHTLIPKDRKTAASDSLIEYVKQGRKPGCSLVIATQQPSAINSEVLSQLDLMFVHQLVFEDDIKAVSKRMPANMPKEWNVGFIRSLKVGEVIVGDRETTSAYFVKIRPRKSYHAGRSTLAVSKPKLRIEKVKGEVQKKKKVIPMVRENLTLEEAEKIAEKFLEKFLVLKREKFIAKMKIYWPFWLVRALSEEGQIEFLFDGVFGEIEGSKGLQKVSNLSPIAVKILMHSGTAEEIAEKVGIDERGAKLQLNRLMKLGLVKAKGKKKPVFIPKVLIPKKIKEFEGEIVNSECEGRILRYAFEPTKRLISALGYKMIEKRLIYIPFAYFKTDKRKEILVNLTNGEAEVKKLRLRI